MDEDAILDALINLKIAEKRLSKVISRSENLEKSYYKKLVKALLIKDYKNAKKIAKNIIEQRKKRRIIESFLNKIRDAKHNLELTLALKTYEDSVKIIKRTIGDLEKSVEKIVELDSADINQILELADIYMEKESTLADENAIEDLIKRAELAVLESVEEKLPEVSDELIENEVESIEQERED